MIKPNHLLFLGSPKVGITSYFKAHRFSQINFPTSGGDVFFQLWERETPHRPDGYALFFAHNDMASFHYALKKYRELRETGRPIVVCGNKSDLIPPPERARLGYFFHPHFKYHDLSLTRPETLHQPLLTFSRAILNNEDILSLYQIKEQNQSIFLL